MKRLLFVWLLMMATAFGGEIDERKIDLYFGNGIWNSYDSAEKSMKKLQKRVDKYIIKSDPQLMEKYGEIDLAYNWTGTSPDNDITLTNKVYDLIETFYQLRDAGQLPDTMNIYTYIADVMGGDIAVGSALMDQILYAYTSSIRSENLEAMRNYYKEQSLDLSHRVLLIAHSQGPLFGNEIYDMFNWEKEYFKMVSIGSLADRVLEGIEPNTTLVCDRAVAVPGIFTGALQGDINCTGVEDHKHNHELVANYLRNPLSLMDIMTSIEQEAQKLDLEPSQWKVNGEYNKGTKDYRANIEHKYDASITVMSGIDIYPFNIETGKIYHVSDTTGGNGWVMGSCEGAQVLVAWTDKKDYQFYKLDGTDPVEYIEGTTCKDPSLFEIIEQSNVNTSSWRISVRNKETNETKENIFPFNLQGSLYQLKSGEWVLASCGGKTIASNWSNQQDNEYYLLNETGEKIVGLSGIEFQFIVEYSIDIVDQGNNVIKLSHSEKFVAPESSCGFYEGGGSSGKTTERQNDSVYLQETLDWERKDQEYWFYTNFPTYVGGSHIQRDFICFAEEKGYQLSDYSTIERGEEKRYMIMKNYQTQRFVLEQKYILKL